MFSCQFEPEQWSAEQFELSKVPPALGKAKRQSEYLAGRICAREALRALSGESLIVSVGDDGAPQWPEQVVGSISHSQGHAMAVVACAKHWQGIGLDVEMQLSHERALRLAEGILTPTEQTRLLGLDSAQQAWLISLTFSLKESLFKALYPIVQQRFYFQAAELTAMPESGTAHLRLLQDLHPQWQAGSLLKGQFSQREQQLISLIAIPAES